MQTKIDAGSFCVKDSSFHCSNKHKSIPGLGLRHLIALMLFLALASSYALRINISVGIVAMVNNSASHPEFNKSQSCPLSGDLNESSSGYPNGYYNWDENTQGLILGAFYYGYTLTNFVGGRAAECFGGRLVIGIGVLVTGILALLIPPLASVSSWLVVLLRILQGMAQGCLFPSTSYILAQWFPVEERSKAAGFVFTGANVGTVLVMTTSGLLCGSNFLGGWPSVFYIYGTLGVIFSVTWIITVRGGPEVHPWISKEEKSYICKEIAHSKKDVIPIPWRSILSSKYFYALAVANFGNNWGYYTLLSELPTYLDKILHINIKNNGVLSSLPYLATVVFSILYSIIVGIFLRKNTVSVLFVRRLSMALAGYVPMLCLFLMCFVGCNSSLALAILIISGGFTGCVNCGYLCSHADLAPRFAGTLMGLTNTIGTIPGFVSPALTGYLTEDNQTIGAWQIVFLVASVCYGICTSIYIVVITADTQPWNDGERKKECGNN